MLDRYHCEERGKVNFVWFFAVGACVHIVDDGGQGILAVYVKSLKVAKVAESGKSRRAA